MKPGRRIHADNPLWLAGPDAGLATKVPTATAALAEGRYRSIRPAPQLDNYEMWVLSSRLDQAASMRVLNVVNEPVTAAGWPAAWVGGPCDGIFVPPAGGLVRQHVVVDYDAIGAAEEHWFSNDIGRNWSVAAVPASGMFAPRLAADSTSRTVGMAQNNVAGTRPFFSTAGGVWTTWPAGSPLGQWVDIDWGGVGANARWVVGGLLPGAPPVPTVLTSASTVAAFAAPATPPVFAGVAPVLVTAYSHHYAGDIYPDDAGNPLWVALTSTEASISIDATADVWTAPVLHGIASPFVDADYSKISGEWISVHVNGTISRSSDGLVWVNDAAAIPAPISPLTSAKIATDGFGHWMLAQGDVAGGGVAKFYASHDDGATWHWIHEQISLPNPAAGVSVWYGDGVFVILAADGLSNGYVMTSLRVAD